MFKPLRLLFCDGCPSRLTWSFSCPSCVSDGFRNNCPLKTTPFILCLADHFNAVYMRSCASDGAHQPSLAFTLHPSKFSRQLSSTHFSMHIPDSSLEDEIFESVDQLTVFSIASSALCSVQCRTTEGVDKWIQCSGCCPVFPVFSSSQGKSHSFLIAFCSRISWLMAATCCLTDWMLL